MNFIKFLRAPFLLNNSGRLLLFIRTRSFPLKPNVPIFNSSFEVRLLLKFCYFRGAKSFSIQFIDFDFMRITASLEYISCHVFFF